MPPKKSQVKRSKHPPARSQYVCQHDSLLVESSHHAAEVGYSQPTAGQKAKAQGLKPHEFKDRPGSFPAPLVLPGDDLALDPTHPPQSILSWTRLKSRNAVTSRRKTIYLVAPPSVDPEVLFVSQWTKPSTLSSDLLATVAQPYPDFGHVVDYVRAFYHPLPVKLLPSSTFGFVSWSPEDQAKLKSTRNSPALIGLKTQTEVVGIRTRDAQASGFPRQLNLDDLLDAAIASLPSDAYAMLMMVDHDLYEDEDDVFVCGRAYGGSRVAVVSSARYNPALDVELGLDLEHVWPTSHCKEFVEKLNAQAGPESKPSKSKSKSAARTAAEAATVDSPADVVMPDSENDDIGARPTPPLYAAVDAVRKFRSQSVSASTPTATSPTTYSWLCRLSRTISHELGHCFGIGHCVHYACVMQGSASLLEDARQPMHPCPVDLEKILRATDAVSGQKTGGKVTTKALRGGSEEGQGTLRREKEWIEAMRGFCARHEDDETFVALGAWLAARATEVELDMDGHG